jgi:anti-sigma factor ChrR (cupin superfamily)
MRINADFGRRAVVHASSLDWTPSPVPGVERKMLDRVGDEVARATSIVRFKPGSVFSAHTHHGGEEFLVLEGVFQDERGDYGVGCYVRNPPMSHHTPRSAEGCTIFVKLHQFDPSDRTLVRMEIGASAPDAVDLETGVTRLSLFQDEHETVSAESWAAGARLSRDLPGGLEALVLSGSLGEGGDTLTRLSWLRLPAGSRLDAIAGPEGAKVWLKTGHLLGLGLTESGDVSREPFRLGA